VPKIDAPSVAEHVARREAAILATATRLFAEHPPSEVTLADIGREVGLARNSIYRYFPDKAHLLAAWFNAVLAPLQAASTEIAERAQPAPERLDAWLTLHLDYLTTPEHRALVAAASEPAPDDVRAEIGAGHHQLYATLEVIVADQLRATAQRRRDPAVLSRLVSGMLQSAATLVIGGADAVAVGRELRAAARAAVGAEAAKRR
jgi:AcrR family transcriptional regulator